MPAKPKHNWLKYYMFIIAFLAFFTLVIRPGLELSKKWDILWLAIDTLIILSFLMNFLLRFIWSTSKKKFLYSNKLETAIIFIFLTQLAIITLFWSYPEIRLTISQFGIVSITKIYIIMAQIFILLGLISQLGQINARIATLPLPPSLLFMGSFLTVIIIGTILLLLPGATKQGIKFIDALFTAASATCVTGLIVVPTGSFFTRYGHTVILVLIQIGGLGLMTFATFAALILRGEIGIKERMVVGDILNMKTMNKIKSLVGAIIGFTITLEIIGTLFLYFALDGYHNLTTGKLYFSMFHSVSAFCNAGFSLWDDNLVHFVNNPLGSITVMTLIVIGGIGFIVLADYWQYFKLRLLRKPPPYIRIHSKLAVIVTVILILSGAIIFYLLEIDGRLAPLSSGLRWIAAFFHSITPRTAGFNTLDTSALSPATLFMLIIFMFIGASPGSTGGGIKTTTLGVLALMIISRIRGDEKIHIFGRNIPHLIIIGAAMVLFLGLAVVSAGVFFLTIFEPNTPLMDLLFEEMSAFGTVGLSTGITPSLSIPAKLVIIITMFLGRIGPLTFLTAVVFKKYKSRIKLPDEEVMIG
ncbi:hypothetical protein DRQ33_00585 [bacterium]|nr:MAG: hypothetical protein DRQ33_00585 [bacterium]